MMLARVIVEQWHAVQRDLISLGYRSTRDEVGVGLSVWELISIIGASPPGTAVHNALSEGWSREAHLLANLGEAESGLMRLTARYVRPGVDEPEEQVEVTPVGAFGAQFEIMTVDELEAKRSERRGEGVA